MNLLSNMTILPKELQAEINRSIESNNIEQLDVTLQRVLSSGVFVSNTKIMNQIAFMIRGLPNLQIVSSNIPIPRLIAADDILAARHWVGSVVSRTGNLKGNDEYNPGQNSFLSPFPLGTTKLDDSDTYWDLIALEDKNVLSALIGSPDTLVFKINRNFLVITKSDLFKLMNDSTSIKYECSNVCSFETDGLRGISQNSMKSVPYLSLGSFSQFQGLVSFSHLWHIISSPRQQSQAYELVDASRSKMLSISSHEFLFGHGAAGVRAVSAAHCQEGQDASTVYEIHILPIAKISITIEQLQIKLYTLFFQAMDPDDPSLLPLILENLFVKIQRIIRTFCVTTLIGQPIPENIPYPIYPITSYNGYMTDDQHYLQFLTMMFVIAKKLLDSSSHDQIRNMLLFLSQSVFISFDQTKVDIIAELIITLPKIAQDIAKSQVEDDKKKIAVTRLTPINRWFTTFMPIDSYKWLQNLVGIGIITPDEWKNVYNRKRARTPSNRRRSSSPSPSSRPRHHSDSNPQGGSNKKKSKRSKKIGRNKKVRANKKSRRNKKM